MLCYPPIAADVAIGAMGVAGIVGSGIAIVFVVPVVCSR